ncbi:predicted protein [Chaetoceros tenuissimus]|uniref:Uncharacterized protein n=1 Tax=Chaetoceros tenuissimus TaxID=426638 RepID=A0AAD3H1E1_9STRA|nr:predicted protein [Chaetoceros tenuissimus]
MNIHSYILFSTLITSPIASMENVSRKLQASRNLLAGIYNHRFNNTDDYYYDGFIQDGIVSRQCEATTSIILYSPNIYSDQNIAEIQNGVTLQNNSEDDTLVYSYCENGSCDHFQNTCEAHGGQFVTATFPSYNTDDCSLSYIDQNFPFCMGWDCDDNEVQSFMDYLHQNNDCNSHEAVTLTSHDKLMRAYPGDLNAGCFADMVDLFFYSDAYNVFQLYDMDGVATKLEFVMKRQFCERSQGRVVKRRGLFQFGKCAKSFANKKPICISKSCSNRDVEMTLEYLTHVSKVFDINQCPNSSVFGIPPAIASDGSLTSFSVVSWMFGFAISIWLFI